MGKKAIIYAVKGMNRDLSVSAFSNQFAYENMNLRLVTNDGNTQMSWVNERGPLYIDDLRITDKTGKAETADTESIVGCPVGTAVIDHKLVIFTSQENSKGVVEEPDRIYVIRVVNSDDPQNIYAEGSLLFLGNLKLDISNPVETLISYEAPYIQKVYWTDGINQPRIINIAESDEKILKWNTTGEPVCTVFDFVPAIVGSGTITAEKSFSGGTFAPGVIQYCITYFNKYRQQSNVVALTPLNYLCYEDRAGGPEDSVTCSFKLTISGIDHNYDYVRIYSIHRSTYDGTPAVNVLTDLPIKSDTETIVYTDNGTTGSSVDFYELLYSGGREITALTMVDKDNTLFLGNIVEPNVNVTQIQDKLDGKRESGTESDRITVEYKADKQLKLNHVSGIYSNTNTLSLGDQSDITTFKGGETYRLGFQLQKKNGEWLEPLFIGDYGNSVYPATGVYSDTVSLVSAHCTLKLDEILGSDYKSLYRMIRPLIVYPNLNDRHVLCQGVVNPTVFNVIDRMNNSPYAQASWFFRPYIVDSEKIVTDSARRSASYGASNKNNSSVEIITDSTAKKDNGTDITMNETNAYALIATVKDSEIDTILKDGCIRYLIFYSVTDNGDGTYTIKEPAKTLSSVMFNLGIVVLSRDNEQKTATYAFLRSEPWPGESAFTVKSGTGNLFFADDDASTLYAIHYGYYVDSVVSTGNENGETVLYYNGLDISSQFVQYTNPDGLPSDYYMYITVNETNTTYEIDFASVGDSVYSQDDTVSGSNTEYKHYESIASQENSNWNSFDENYVKKIEIQGSKNVFDSAYDRDPKHLAQDSYLSSNTQYMIDQSIVTLNSPDIEFDTMVQKYPMDSVHLRIVGAVPVTAGVSAHHISVASNMLEAYHNDTSNTAKDAKKGNILFGVGELDSNVTLKNISLSGGNRLVSDYLWNDVRVKTTDDSSDADDGITTSGTPWNFLVYPWQRNGSLNNDWRAKGTASSWLDAKRMSNLLYSIESEYLDNGKFVSFKNVSGKIHLQENGEVINYRLGAQRTAGDSVSSVTDINYYANIDKVLYNKNGYWFFATDRLGSTESNRVQKITSPVSMKYKSGSHAVLALKSESSGDSIPILPYSMPGSCGKFSNPAQDTSDTVYSTTFWGEEKMYFNQQGIDISDLFVNGSHQKLNFLWLAEIYKEPVNAFGGTDRTALLANNWLIGGDSINITDDTESVELIWNRGDTYYQRYDCMKTYPFANDDQNQLTEILSFMCETRVNIDGRYDLMRGQTDNTYMNPSVFNKVNSVYSQPDNFFNYQKTGVDGTDRQQYSNQVWYSKMKTSGADIDQYTNVTLASVLELDGGKGDLKLLRKLNNSIYALQDQGISQILYNENVQMSTKDGVPVEIANSGKVTGKRYITEDIGCQNKWASVLSPSGLYFVDSNNKAVYRLNGQGVTNLTGTLGMNVWARNSIPSYDAGWNPLNFGDLTLHYDRTNSDILVTQKDISLAYSEKTGLFTSFYNYGNTQYLCNMDDSSLWLKYDDKLTGIYLQGKGEYCDFFGETKPYWTILTGSSDVYNDKIFTGVEFRTLSDDDGQEDGNRFNFTRPFDNIEVWNDYQHGKAEIARKSGYGEVLHHKQGDSLPLSRKFRIWRCDVPRDNASINSDKENIGIGKFAISRSNARPLDRIRNPWVYLKLQKDSGSIRTEIQNVTLTYYN